MTPRVVIIGAGPAGVRAAERLVRAGLRPVVVDEAMQCGGQIYRQPPEPLKRPARELYGFEAARATSVHQTFEALRPHIDYRPRSLLWHVEGRTLHLLQTKEDGHTSNESMRFDALILATGATERVLPCPGWTLPGVFTLGAAQISLKAQAALMGPRVVFAGTGPLLYLVAWQYAKQGAHVVGVLDESAAITRWKILPQMMARPAVILKAAWIVASLRLAGVPLHQGVRLIRADEDTTTQSVHAVTWQDAQGQRHTTACDALALGHGLRSESQAADLAGCAFDFDPVEQTWLPRADALGRSSVAGVYLAGDGAQVRGADAAELAGALAACAALQDLSLDVADQEIASLQQALRAHDTFRVAMSRLSEPRLNWAQEAPDDLVVCRCEEVTAGALRQCAKDTGAAELNRLKAFTRIGMGRCQGRMCSPGAARLLAHAQQRPLQEVGRLRSQPPIKPVPLHALGAGRAGGAVSAVPPGERDD